MRKLIIASLLILGLMRSFAQTDLTFYHMGAATPQSGVYNPTFFPNAKIYFSLPVLSGFNANVNSGFSYGDLMTPVQGTDSVKVDLEGWISNLKPGERMSMNGSVSVFQFGMRRGNRTFSLSSNYRFDVSVLYPIDFLDYFISGNGAYLGQRIEETSLAASGILYQETGLAYSQEIAMENGNLLTVGVRIKYLQGMLHVGTQKDASVTMFTDTDTYDMTVQFKNAVFNTAGLNEINGSNALGYLLSPANNGNSGIGFDLGAQYQLNEKIDLSLAINDLGSITWTNDTENHELIGGEINFIGFDGLDTLDIGGALNDSLDVWTKNDTNKGSFKTSIGPKIFASSSYRVNEFGTATATLGLLRSYFGKSQVTYGIGYTQKVKDILVASTTVSGRGKQSVHVGLGLSARFGFFQLYTAVDNLSGLLKKADSFQGSDVRLGINFMIGRGGVRTVPTKKEEKPERKFPDWYYDEMEDTGE
ncbi:MAG: conjugal transfer protein TraF [Cytophagales bacterium]|nr:conjugal transfer protein TraF [Cytophagales bacterium]